MTIAVSAVNNGFGPARPYMYDQLRTYRVNLSTNQQLGINDPVALANGLVVPATAGNNPDLPGFGVVVGLLDPNGRPLTFSQPVRGPYLTSGAQGQAVVLADPGMTFRVNYTGSAGNDAVGELVEVTGMNIPVSGTGISQAAIAAATSASTTLLFRTMNLAGNQVANQTGVGRYMEVAWNRHINRLGFAGSV
jgi:uncharacterized protein RhaS with RHS repeats